MSDPVPAGQSDPLLGDTTDTKPTRPDPCRPMPEPDYRPLIIGLAVLAVPVGFVLGRFFA